MRGSPQSLQSQSVNAQRARAEFRTQLAQLTDQLQKADPDLADSLQRAHIARVSETHNRVTAMVMTSAKGDPLSASDQQLKENLPVKMAEWEVAKGIERAFQQATNPARQSNIKACL